jgi:hypothetical protein
MDDATIEFLWCWYLAGAQIRVGQANVRLRDIVEQRHRAGGHRVAVLVERGHREVGRHARRRVAQTGAGERARGVERRTGQNRDGEGRAGHVRVGANQLDIDDACVVRQRRNVGELEGGAADIGDIERQDVARSAKIDRHRRGHHRVGAFELHGKRVECRADLKAREERNENAASGERSCEYERMQTIHVTKNVLQNRSIYSMHRANTTSPTRTCESS